MIWSNHSARLLGLALIVVIALAITGCTGVPASGVTSADVVVVGGTPGGVAAAVAAAREGRSVILVEPTAHVGGIVGSGLTNVDIIKEKAVGGIFREFVAAIRKHYVESYGENSPQYKECRKGFHFEPKVAEATFLSLLKEQGDRIRILYRHRLARAIVKECTLVGAEFDDLATGRRVSVNAEVFIDATYEGDLAAMAGVAFRVGREARDEFKEKHAGRIYARFGHDEFLPGSTGEGDEGIQAFCFRFMLTRVPENRVALRKPPGYSEGDYRHLLADIEAGKIKSIKQAVQFWPLPNDRFEINSDHAHPDTGVPSESLDLAEENWAWPTASYEQRKRIFDRIWSYQEGLVWFLQNDARVPQTIRDEASQYGFCKDEFTDNENRPWQVYVRQGRRIEGEYRLTENDGNLFPTLNRTKVQPTSIAIAEYPFDSHAVHKFDPAHPGVREGYFYIKHEPIQLPYGVIVPKKIDGLLVPVACSATHVGYQTIRMEPVFMALGQAAGLAASRAIEEKTAVRAINVDQLQRRIVESGGVITYYDDLPFDHADYKAMQFLGGRSVNPGYKATPDMKLNRKDGWTKLARIMEHSQMAWPEFEGDAAAPLQGTELVRWLVQHAKLKPDPCITISETGPITLAEFSRVVYDALINRAGAEGRK